MVQTVEPGRAAWQAGLRSGTTVYKINGIDRPWSAGDNVSHDVGQGDQQATPLQVAVAYSALAHGGQTLTDRRKRYGAPLANRRCGVRLTGATACSASLSEGSCGGYPSLRVAGPSKRVS